MAYLHQGHQCGMIELLSSNHCPYEMPTCLEKLQFFFEGINFVGHLHSQELILA